MLAEQLLLVDEAWPLLHPAELRGAGLPGFQGKGWRITPLRQQPQLSLGVSLSLVVVAAAQP